MNTRYQAGTRVSEFRLEEPLAAGSFGEVWRARHHLWDDNEVAIKLPTAPEYVRYLQREGSLVHALQHPNIVRVLGVDPFAEIPYLVMELIRGPSLDRVIAESPSGLEPAAAGNILTGILRALEAAHAAGILHRDLKPANVLLHLNDASATRRPADARPDDVRLTDFGLGAGGPDAMRSIVASVAAPAADALVGTLAYMAPEIRDGSRPPDARSDLYSAGVVLFEMLTGERPAGAELPSAVRPGLPTGWDSIFSRLYARHDRRVASASEALAALAPLTRPGSPVAPKVAAAAGRALYDGPNGRMGPPRLPQSLICDDCTHVNPGDSQFCEMCGAQLVPHVRRCVKCGGWPGPADVHCIRCGTRLPVGDA
jgi:serine/threonine protein kinase